MLKSLLPLAAAAAVMTCTTAAIAQDLIVIPDRLDRSTLVAPTQGANRTDTMDLIGRLSAIEIPPLIIDPGLSVVSSGSDGFDDNVDVAATKGQKDEVPIASCVGPIEVRVDTGSPRSQGTARCGKVVAHCTVPLTGNKCTASAGGPQTKGVGKCRVVAGQADAATAFCRFGTP